MSTGEDDRGGLCDCPTSGDRKMQELGPRGEEERTPKPDPIPNYPVVPTTGAPHFYSPDV